MSPAPTAELTLQIVGVLALGSLVIVALAALMARAFGAGWQRPIWQMTFIALSVLIVAELSGAANAGVRYGRDAWRAFASLLPEKREEPRIREVRTQPLRPVTEAPRRAPLQGIEAAAPAVPGFRRPEPTLDREESYHAVPVAWASRSAPQPPRAALGPGWPVLLWGAGALVLFGRIVIAHGLLLYLRLRRTALGPSECPVDIRRLGRDLGVRRPVTVLRARGLTGPLAFGLRRPVILVPSHFLDEFDAAQQRVVLTHELAHLAQRDPLWLCFSELVRAVLWWHPAVWWARRRLHDACELAADDATRAVPDGPRVLAECLVALGRLSKQRSLAGSVAVFGLRTGPKLGRRVERLLKSGNARAHVPHPVAVHATRSLMPLVLVFASLTTTPWARSHVPEGGSPMRILEHSWRGSLVALTFAAMVPLTIQAFDDDDAPSKIALEALLESAMDRETLNAALEKSDKAPWSSTQATGAPDTPQPGDHPTAWASATEDGQLEWLLLEFADAAVPARVDIHETCNPGAVFCVSVIPENGREMIAWSGTDPTSVESSSGVSKIALDCSSPVRKVRIFLDSERVPGWNEIDAVALVSESGASQWAVSATASSVYASGEPSANPWTAHSVVTQELFPSVRFEPEPFRMGFRTLEYEPLGTEVKGFGPEQATGAPDTHRPGDHGTAWAPKTRNGGVEWLQLSYGKPVSADGVVIYATHHPGAVVRVTFIGDDGAETELWSGEDPTAPEAAMGVSFIPLDGVTVECIRIYLDCSKVSGWNEIDAVGLVSGDTTHWASSATASSTYKGTRSAGLAVAEPWRAAKLDFQQLGAGRYRAVFDDAPGEDAEVEELRREVERLRGIIKELEDGLKKTPR